jgi:hypothetical protein
VKLKCSILYASSIVQLVRIFETCSIHQLNVPGVVKPKTCGVEPLPPRITGTRDVASNLATETRARAPAPHDRYTKP